MLRLLLAIFKLASCISVLIPRCTAFYVSAVYSFVQYVTYK